jgi:glycosyltransferase involved in cell wall biosynthesis
MLSMPGSEPSPDPGPAVSDVPSVLEEIFANAAVAEIIPVLQGLKLKGSYGTAYQVARVNFDAWAGNVQFLKLYRTIVTQLGMLSEVNFSTYKLVQARAATPDSLRSAEGKLKEISGWVPSIAGGTKAIVPASANRVLHLVKESRPYYSNGFTARSHNNFLAERAAGLEPIVMTEPGASRRGSSAAVPSIESYECIVHHHLDVGGLDVSRLPNDQFLSLFADLAYERVRDIRPALIHVSSGRRGFDTGLVGVALKRKTGLPLVYEVRSFFESNWTANPDLEMTGEIFERRSNTESLVMAEADLILTIGEAMREELENKGVVRERIGIIPNGVDAQVFRPVPRHEPIANRLGLGNLPTFGYVSNMDHHRESQETLIRAVSVLAGAGSPLRCVLVGDGPRRQELEKLAQDLSVADRVIFTGAVEHSRIRDYYSLIDIFVVPRTSERAARFVTPLKPFEAMAMGKPVIVSDLPALREIVAPPSRGLVFPVDDHQALAEILMRLHADESGAKQLGDVGREWVTKERSWLANGHRYVDYFSRLITSEAR